MSYKYRNNTGFTLIELLVVVLIIGILAAVATPQYMKVVEKSRISEVKSLYGAVASAQMRYQPSSGLFAVSIAELDLIFPGPGGANITGKYYNCSITAGGANGFSFTCTRTGTPPARYGAYSVAVVYTAATAQTNITVSGACGAYCGDLPGCDKGAATCPL
ncbi:MAG: prepilin-type N-terminal cleavage/methylation domain-containing protein [bacterium]